MTQIVMAGVAWDAGSEPAACHKDEFGTCATLAMNVPVGRIHEADVTSIPRISSKIGVPAASTT